MDSACAKWRVASAVALGIAGWLVVALLAGRSEQAGAQGVAQPAPTALTKLEKIAKQLDQAGKHVDSPGDPFIKDAREAERVKYAFVREGFADQAVSGCALGELVRRMLEIDDYLNLAKREVEARKAALGTAELKAKVLAQKVKKCAEDNFTRSQAQLVAREIKALDQGDAGFGQAVSGIAKEKRRLLVGEQVYGCDVVGFFDNLETIDAALGEVDHYRKGQSTSEIDDDLIDVRRKAVRKARGALRKLTRSWRLVPCGGGTVPPNEAPVIEAFTSVFGTSCSTCTLYTVTATDAEDGTNLTYSWDKQPPPLPGADPEATDCGAFTPPDPLAPGVVPPGPNQAIWNHPNEPRPGVPTGCHHDATEHPGLISVVVTDTQGLKAACIYEAGSAPTTTDDPAVNC